MTSIIHWGVESARVVACAKCTRAIDSKLLRDEHENVPQPGYIGSRYSTTGLMLVGQNPGVPNLSSLAKADLPYTQALRALRDSPTKENYDGLQSVLRTFIPSWPVHGAYFPLAECGLELDDIAYCNVVRCRTQANAPPGRLLTQNCLTEHFERWLSLLKPNVVIFIGKWAHDRASASVSRFGIPSDFMNRQRSLASAERMANRERVVRLVRASVGLVEV